MDTLIITGLVSLLVGALGSPVILHLLRRGKNSAETKQLQLDNEESQLKMHITESDVMKQLKNEVAELMSQNLEAHKLLQAAQMERDGLEMVVKIKEGEVIDFGRMMSDILIRQGESIERERRCQSELTARKNEIIEINEKMAALSDKDLLIFELKGKLRATTTENMQMKAILKNDREQGKKHDDEEVN